MAEKRQHNAKMNAKGLEDAVSDDEARKMIETQGGRSLFLVEAVHGKYETAIDGQQTINLIPGVVVRVPDDQAKPVRDLLRALALGGGGAQALSYDDPADAFVPPVDTAAAAVQDAADTAAAAIPDPAPAGDGDPTGEPLPTVESGGPWPGDEGYEAPGQTAEEAAVDPFRPEGTGDDVAAARAKRTRGKAAGE